MATSNQDIATFFEEIADLLELQNANPFRVRAYRTAARNLRDYPHDVAAMVAKKADLDNIPGIGEDLAKKIVEAVETGKLKFLDYQKKKLSESLDDAKPKT